VRRPAQLSFAPKTSQPSRSARANAERLHLAEVFQALAYGCKIRVGVFARVVRVFLQHSATVLKTGLALAIMPHPVAKVCELSLPILPTLLF
jgi:hypothetical protein